MMGKSERINKYIPVIIISIIHLCITFFTDRKVFIYDNPLTNADYIICKILCFFFLFFFYLGLYNLIFNKDKASSIRKIILFALPYLLVVIAILFIKLPGGYISNDETLIYDAAVNLEHYTWFYYITTYYYIISLMLIPTYFGPVFMKAAIELLVVGYVVYRSHKHYGKWGLLSYILFLLYPFIAYTASAHRLPIYFLLYLAMICKLYFDRLEGINPSGFSVFVLILLIAVLTQWRTEGIYLALFGPILLFVTYPSLRNKKSVFMIILVSVLIQYIISIPQNGMTADNLSAKADDRMKPFYAYTITNMMRNGLDREKNAEDLAIVDKYLSLEAIDAINEYYEDINYEDVLILYQPGFVGTREDAGVTDFVNYADALKRIFINNPDVFIRTRIGAFIYSALPFHITPPSGGISGMVHCLISVVKTISYNLFIPLGIILALCIFSLIRIEKHTQTFFITLGLLAHWFIVFILAPASYFKYYFPVYIVAYFYVIAGILLLISRMAKKEQSL